MEVPTDSTFVLAAVPAAEATGTGPSALEAQVTALFDELRRPLLRYLLSCRLSTHDSEEVIQDVFLALFRHLQAGKPQHNLRGWIFRVAHNQALKRHNAARDVLRHVAPAHEHAVERHRDPAPGPEAELRARQRQQRLLAVVAALPERDRQCLHLRAEGLRYREIAEVLGISLGGVSLSLTRSLGKLSRADGH